MPTAQWVASSPGVTLPGGLPSHLLFSSFQDHSSASDPSAAWGWFGAYAMPLAACLVLILLSYRYRTSSRAPNGLRRAARFENSCERVLVSDALLVALGTPVVLFFSLALWFFPGDMALYWPGLHDEPVRFATTALAFAGAAAASGWLAPDSLARIVVSIVGMGLALALPELSVAERLQLAGPAALALAWFAFVLPFARHGVAHRFRPAALTGALLFCVVSAAPLIAVRCGPPDTPLMAATLAAEGR